MITRRAVLRLAALAVFTHYTAPLVPDAGPLVVKIDADTEPFEDFIEWTIRRIAAAIQVPEEMLLADDQYWGIARTHVMDVQHSIEAELVEGTATQRPRGLLS